jgi:FtsP/CotA-like multicopper oxidase with cupredoxin domain
MGIPVPEGARRLPDPPINLAIGAAFCGGVNLQSAVGFVTHLHGARVRSDSDGWPLAPVSWAGNPYGFPTAQTHRFPNQQRSAQLWYHDHSMDNTGHHVMAGLAGMYFVRDSADDAIVAAIGGAAQEWPVLVQDRILRDNGTAFDYSAGTPELPEYSRPEFMGTTLFINGRPSPQLQIERRVFRLRLLNGSNARTYALALCDVDALARGAGRLWYTDCLRVIGADGGLLSRSIGLGALDVLVIAPGQRRDVLLDTSALPFDVCRLMLTNLALVGLLDADNTNPEAIFTTLEDSVLVPTQLQCVAGGPDATLYAALSDPLANLMRLDLDMTPLRVAVVPDRTIIDSTLANAASDDDFDWDGTSLVARPGAVFGPNRFVLLMSNTEGFDPAESGNGISGWSDVQIFELTQGGTGPAWQMPFAVDLQTPSSPPRGLPSDVTSYVIGRRLFFDQATSPDITVAGHYPGLATPVITPSSGTYERWYVANVGNSQPLSGDAGEPDMHPFHVHLVNFVVTGRWVLDPDNPGRLIPDAPDPLDGIARQDTVVVPSNTLLELLVWFPVGYTGDYVYHCHLLEHEDNCMMSSFRVT